MQNIYKLLELLVALFSSEDNLVFAYEEAIKITHGNLHNDINRLELIKSIRKLLLDNNDLDVYRKKRKVKFICENYKSQLETILRNHYNYIEYEGITSYNGKE